MGAWRDHRNAQARDRLEHARPTVFPEVVLQHARSHAFVPPLPRLAVQSYWSAHPLRAERLARGLAARSGAPEGWRWRLGMDNGHTSFRTPPAPFREAAYRRGPGHCCICGQPVFRFGWHVDLWQDGRPNRRAEWHAGCVIGWKLWLAPQTHVVLLRRLQKRRCAATGTRLLRTSHVDHRLPLFQIWRDRRDEPWPHLLGYWGLDNLQVINRPAHTAKSAVEAAERAAARRMAGATASPPL